MKREQKVTRRDFLGFTVWAVGGLLSLGMGIPGIAYIVGPALKRLDSNAWVRLGSASKVELQTPTLFKAKIVRQTGWIMDERELSVYIYTENGRDYEAMSNICTHLGCRVRWIDAQEQFFCPCHNAAFDKQGEVTDGPPPRALDRYEVKVEDDQLYILAG